MWSQEAEKDISIFIFLIRWFIRIIELIFTVILEFISILLFVVVDQSLNCVWLFVTPWTEACQAPLSSTISWSSLKFMSIDSVMLSNHLPPSSPIAFNLSQFQGHSNELVLHIRWPKYWSFSFSISPSDEYSGLFSFRIDWFDLLVVQGTLKSLLQYPSSKASIVRCSTFLIVQLSHLYMATGKTIALTIWTMVSSKVLSLLFHMLSRFLIAFLPRSKQTSFNFMVAVAIHSDFGAQDNKVCHCLHFLPHLFASRWWDRMPWS